MQSSVSFCTDHPKAYAYDANDEPKSGGISITFEQYKQLTLKCVLPRFIFIIHGLFSVRPAPSNPTSLDSSMLGSYRPAHLSNNMMPDDIDELSDSDSFEFTPNTDAINTVPAKFSKSDELLF